MAHTSGRRVIDAWAQPAFKASLLPEVVRLFEQSGSAHLLLQDLGAAQLVENGSGCGSRMLCANIVWRMGHHK